MIIAPRKPFWKRKRWIAVAVLWLMLPLIYIGSTAPVSYCSARGWFPRGPTSAYFGPWSVLARHDWGEPLRHYNNWGWLKGKEHRDAIIAAEEAELRRRAMNPDNAPAWVPPLPPP